MNTRVRTATEPGERFFLKRGSSFRDTSAPVRPNPWGIRRPQILQGESLPVEITEDRSEYKIIVPLAGIDPRKVYVFATTRSLLIEIRLKITACHELTSGLVTETFDRRISRELTFPVGIEQGAIGVRVNGDSLQITARKCEREQETAWSQLIHFDTQVSFDLG